MRERFKIPRIKKALKKYIFTNELPPEARLLNIISLAGFAAALAAAIIRVFTGYSIGIIVKITALAVFVLVTMYISGRISRIYIVEKKKAESAGKDLELRNKLLGVVKETSEILLALDTDDLKKTFLEAMELMARCVDADRMSIWRRYPIGGKLKYEQQYEWLGESADGQTLHDKTGSFYIDNIAQWDFDFSAGRYINGPFSSLSEEEQKALSPFGICSVLAIPLFLQEKYWGFVSFDDCRHERTFSNDEISILRSGCLLLANAIVRNNNNIMIKARMRQQELMASISRSFISKESTDKLINDALKKMGEFLGVNRVVVAVMDKEGGGSRIDYIWLSSGEWELKPFQPEFKKIINESFPATVPESGFITAICCNDVIHEFRGKYKKFDAAGIKSFVWAPVYVDGVFWGLISVEECTHNRTWSESDVQLAGTVSSAIAGEVSRSLIDRARTAALEHAVQASTAKGNFLANMSHEIRTPMNAIIGMTSIGKNANTIEKKDYAFEKIENASTHLLGVINDILDMSKIEANKFELSPVTYSFEKMLQKTVNVINFRIEERHQEFTVEIDKNIPQYIVGDDQRLAQVIANLLSNAVKFTGDKGKIHLDAKLISEENGVCTIQIGVSDTGIGISKEHQARLFNSFEQADGSTSRKFGGTGLGLAISKRIVELMNGRVWIESEEGKGSTFAFIIRAQRGTAVQKTPVKESAKKEADNFRDYTMLLAEDVEINREIVLTLLEPTALKIECAENGREALEKFAAAPGRYNMIFMDIQMPEMDGYEATRQIRNLEAELRSASKEPFHEIPIVAMTANVFREDVEKCVAAGMNDHVGKPLDLTEVLEKLRYYLPQK